MSPVVRSDKLDWVDRTRGFAILLVIVVHVSQRATLTDPMLRWLTDYSQMGVQLFFVASAFTLCHALARRRDEPSPQLALYIRRVFRIAPLYWFAVIFYAWIYVANL